MIKFIKHYSKNKVSLIFIIIGSIACIQVLSSIILGRMLTKEDFGMYSFVFRTIVPLITMLALLGQDIAIVRYFSKNDFTHYNWKVYFKRISSAFLIIISLAIFLISLFYKLHYSYYIFMFLAIFSNTILNLIGSLLRSKQNFTASIFLTRGTIILFVCFVVLLFLFNFKSIQSFSVLRTLSYIATCIIVCLFFFRRYPNGSKPISRSIYSDGILLWGIGLTLLVIGRIDAFFIVKYLDFKAVAGYSILSAFIQIYDFATQAIYNVYSQKFSSHYKPDLKRFLSKIILIALLISVFYFIFGKPILHFIFKGKYDEFIFLLLPFCMIGCLRLIYMYPSCYFIGKSDTHTLKSFLKYNLIGVFFNILFIHLGLKEL